MTKSHFTLYDLDEGGRYGKDMGKFDSRQEAEDYAQAENIESYEISEGFYINLF